MDLQLRIDPVTVVSGTGETDGVSFGASGGGAEADDTDVFAESILSFSQRSTRVSLNVKKKLSLRNLLYVKRTTTYVAGALSVCGIEANLEKDLSTCYYLTTSYLILNKGEMNWYITTPALITSVP